MSYLPMQELALRLARQAGEEILSQRDNLTIRYKGDIELVTQADVAADKLLSEGIRRRFPDHLILSEELSPDSETDGDHLWVIDPIDGTVNYAHGHFQSAISIAYYYQGKARVAVVHNPFMNETFHAIEGEGAFMNDEPIHCANKTVLDKAIVATGFPYEKETLPLLMQRLSAILSSCADIRRLGSAALDICWVACGRLDAYYESVKPWDFAAAQLIAREAGAKFGHIYPPATNPELSGDHIIVATAALFEPIQSLLREADNVLQSD